MSTTEEAARISDAITARGRAIYEDKLKSLLDPEHMGRFVAIEPETGRYFLGDTGSEALVTAHEAMPESQFYLKRIGYDTTHRLGGYGIRRG